jgi:hypothetical protein
MVTACSPHQYARKALVRRRDVELGRKGVVAPVRLDDVLAEAGKSLGNGAAVVVLLLDELKGEVQAGGNLVQGVLDFRGGTRKSVESGRWLTPDEDQTLPSSTQRAGETLYCC